VGARIVGQCVKHFENCSTGTGNQPCSGRLSTASTKRKKGKINELIAENRNVTVKNVAAEIGIGHSVVQGYGAKFAIPKYLCPVDSSAADGGAYT
jgi:hypothetical protein